MLFIILLLISTVIGKEQVLKENMNKDIPNLSDTKSYIILEWVLMLCSAELMVSPERLDVMQKSSISRTT